MNDSPPFLRFTDVSFSWPEARKQQFASFSAEIPGGFISLTGPNGSGKSTFMLLASGRIMPASGRIELCGQNTRVLSGIWLDESGLPGPGLTSELEHKRNLLCSYIYQNMEFDSQDEDASPLGTLLEYVYDNGACRTKSETFYNDVVKTFELEGLRGRKLDALSKGEVQRALLAFSALYGSRVIMMDEPLFAMESYQKERALEFFGQLRRSEGLIVMVSLHELALTRKYADVSMLFHPDGTIDLGSCEEVLTPAALEAAYGVPVAMLHKAESLVRKNLLESDSTGKLT